ncbi:UNVERIFIED_CONTAM: hypothetical protein RMT77_007433 [Armadillidium vulgare]
MKVKEVKSCSFPCWYKTFEEVTVESIILQIPPKVLSYLQDKGTLVIPEEAYDNESHELHESDEEWESDSPVAIAPNLKEFNQEIRKSIKRFGGTAFPKLNWSSPKDAVWISYNKSLQCSSPGDVYLLLKSSDFVTHDLTSPYKDCSDLEECSETNYCLILRKWTEINPSDEFRCFVKDKELVGISQRDTSQFYSSVHKEKDLIVEDIALFWEEHIRNYFHLFSYVFDVHRPKNGSVTLIDFGPFGNTTDSLMFSWEELKNMNSSNIPEGVDSNLIEDELWGYAVEPEFRYITNGTGVQPSPYSHYGLPVDIVDLSTGQDPAKLVDFLQMKIQKEGEDSSDSDDDSCIQEESSLSES